VRHRLTKDPIPPRIKLLLQPIKRQSARSVDKERFGGKSAGKKRVLEGRGRITEEKREDGEGIDN